jgi:hypothetical protein
MAEKFSALIHCATRWESFMALDSSEVCKHVVPTPLANGIAVMPIDTLSSDAHPWVRLMGADELDTDESPEAADADDEDEEDDDEDEDDIEVVGHE